MLMLMLWVLFMMTSFVIVDGGKYVGSCLCALVVDDGAVVVVLSLLLMTV